MRKQEKRNKNKPCKPSAPLIVESSIPYLQRFLRIPHINNARFLQKKKRKEKERKNKFKKLKIEKFFLNYDIVVNYVNYK